MVGVNYDNQRGQIQMDFGLWDLGNDKPQTTMQNGQIRPVGSKANHK